MSEWTLAVLRDLHPHWEFMEHDHSPIIDESQVKPEDLVRHTSNMIRYQVLGEIGGIWVDHDVIPLRSFEPLAQAGAFTASIEGHREGSVLGFPPGHPMLAHLLHEIGANSIRDLKSCSLSGAETLDRIGRSYSDVRLEPAVLPFDAMGHSTGVRDPYCVHLWSTSSARWASTPQ